MLCKVIELLLCNSVLGKRELRFFSPMGKMTSLLSFFKGQYMARDLVRAIGGKKLLEDQNLFQNACDPTDSLKMDKFFS